LDDFISFTSFRGVVTKLAVVRLPSGNLKHTQSRVARRGRTRRRGDLQAFRPAAWRPSPLTVWYHGFSGRRTNWWESGWRGLAASLDRPRACPGSAQPPPTWVGHNSRASGGPTKRSAGLRSAGREVRDALALPCQAEAMCARAGPSRASALRRSGASFAGMGGGGRGAERVTL